MSGSVVDLPERAAHASGALGARQRIYVALRRGATVSAAAAQASVSQALAQVMIDEMSRTGLLARAETLCSSGLGACGGADSDEVKLHCAGCPLVPLKRSELPRGLRPMPAVPLTG